MGWMKRQFTCGLLWLLAGMLLWSFSDGCREAYSRHMPSSMVRYRNPSAMLTAADVTGLQEKMAEGHGSVTGWGQSLKETIQNETTLKQSEIDVVWALGDASLLWHLPYVQGQMPGAQDLTGCAVDIQTALLLFGSTDIVGKSVKIGEHSLEIRGVFQLPKGLSGLGANPGRGLGICPAALTPEKVTLTALDFSLFAEDGMSPTEQAKALMRMNALSVDGVFSEAAEVRSLLRFAAQNPGNLLIFLSALELALFLFFGLRFCLRSHSEVRTETIKRYAKSLALGGGVCLCMAAALLWLTKEQPGGGIPTAFLPTRWSDFEFWPELFQSLMEKNADARLTPMLRPDLAMDSLRNMTLGGSAASVLCLLAAWQKLRRGCLYASGMQMSLAALLMAVFPILSAAILQAAGLTVSVISVSIPAVFYGCILLRPVLGETLHAKEAVPSG